ncbi:hypothetical protein CMV_030369 [Castanea mollissima]|uniref:CTLH domain-containing protein n=1 Tax=Castanea mollissima TaxID=60419 RepID=A0A8J4Q187_9ROSI|nr:hypothetical protein CMV_030369 [Castanea mollissima]
MLMENSSTVLGSKGLIRKHEFVRIIIQCLYSLGYKNSASCLESESGISYKSLDFELLESQLLCGNWDGCIDTLNAIKDLMDETRASALFLVFKQCLLECLNRGDDSMALAVLRKEVSASRLGKDKAQNLAQSILSFKDVQFGEIEDNDVRELRKKLLAELEKLLPPPTMLPERRVQIPTETVQILKGHKNEVWFVQFSNNGDYLASSSSDCTAIIWQVLQDGKLMLLHTLRSHQNPVSFVAWSPDDTKLLTCGNGEVLKLWDVETVLTLKKASICGIVMATRLKHGRG